MQLRDISSRPGTVTQVRAGLSSPQGGRCSDSMLCWLCRAAPLAVLRPVSDSAAAHSTQVRECAAYLLTVAKELGCPIFLVSAAGSSRPVHARARAPTPPARARARIAPAWSGASPCDRHPHTHTHTAHSTQHTAHSTQHTPRATRRAPHTRRAPAPGWPRE
jgi:hypothetical protein